MNPDLFRPYDLPDTLRPYFRRAMVAHSDTPVDLTFTARGTGYCYLGWTQSGRWQAEVNGEPIYDTEIDGPLHLSGQINDAEVICRSSGPLRQIFCEFHALGQYEFLGLAGVATLERALDPVTLLAELDPLAEGLAVKAPADDGAALAEVFCAALAALPPSAVAPTHLREIVAAMEASHGTARFGDLVAAAGVSERKARDDFQRLVGLPPKRFSQILQIGAALARLMELEDARLVDLAAQCGFADQAHMTRAFVTFLGDSPMRFLQDLEPTLAQFVGQAQARDGIR